VAPSPEQQPAGSVYQTPAWTFPAVALVCFAGTIGLLRVGDSGFWSEGAGTVALGLVLAAVASLPVAYVRRWPLGVFVLTAVAQSALQLVATPNGPPLGPTVAVFFVALLADGSRQRTQLSLGVVAVMLLVHAGANGVGENHFPGAELLFGGLLWGIAWLAGDRARLRAERIAALEERALRAEREAERERSLAAAEERTRIARDLHDSAGHAINVILVHAGAGRMQADRDPERVREAFGTIEEVARETVGEIDQMVGALREGDGEVEPPPGLAALETLAARHRAAGTEVTIVRAGEQRLLPAAVERGAFRIAQEALTNAARHGAGPVRLEVDYEPRELVLTVTNPVGGAERRMVGGHGLVGMRERALQLGGELEVEPGANAFRVRARLPLAEEDR
jgi:signal transduction histidine kinase